MEQRGIAIMDLLSEIAQEINDEVGIEQVADLGLIYVGRIGYADCQIAAGVEMWEGVYYARIQVTLAKEAGRKVKVIKWPYSDRSAGDLEAFCREWRIIEDANLTHCALPDRRGWLSRGVDWLVRSQHLGEYVFTSGVAEKTTRPLNWKVWLQRWGRSINVTVTEWRSPGCLIQAQFPHPACAKIRQAFAEFALQHTSQSLPH